MSYFTSIIMIVSNFEKLFILEIEPNIIKYYVYNEEL